MKHDQARADNLTASLLTLAKRVEEGHGKLSSLEKVTALLERVAAKMEAAEGKEGGREGGRKGGKKDWEAAATSYSIDSLIPIPQ